MVCTSQHLAEVNKGGQMNFEKEVEDMISGRRKSLQERQRWASSFQVRVLTDQVRLRQQMRAAEQQVQVSKDNFTKSILFISCIALDKFDAQQGCTIVAYEEINLPLTRPNIGDCALAMSASNLILDCGSLLSCYDALNIPPDYISRTPQTRLVIEEDQAEVFKVLQTAQKVAGTELIARLSDEPGEMKDSAVLADEEEEIIARKVMKIGRQCDTPETSTQGESRWGILVGEFEKVMRKIQDLTG